MNIAQKETRLNVAMLVLCVVVILLLALCGCEWNTPQPAPHVLPMDSDGEPIFGEGDAWGWHLWWRDW